MYTPRLVTPPAEYPVSLAEAKAHLRVDHDEEDALISAYIAAATSHLDGITGILGRCLVTQTWVQEFDAPAGVLSLPLAPVASITSVEYLDVAGVWQTVAPENYGLLQASPPGPAVLIDLGYVFPATGFPSPSARVTFVAGSAPSDVPPAIKTAILLMVGDSYRFRETVAVGPATTLAVAATVDRMLTPFRRVLL